MDLSTQKLADFVATCIAELNRREAALRDEILAISRERAALEAAIAAAEDVSRAGAVPPRKTESPTPPVPTQPEIGLSMPNRRARHEMTIKEAVLHVLGGGVGGMTALVILEQIKIQVGMEIERTSLSPQLSRLKADGLIKRDGIIWSKVSTEKNEAPANGNPHGASEPEEDQDGTLGFFK